MQPLTRQLSLAFVLLLVFLTAALTAQTWLAREARRLHGDAITAKRTQFLTALELLPRPPANWDEDFQRDLGALLGASVNLLRGDQAPPPAAHGANLLSFDCPLPGDQGFHARVTFATPAAERLAALQRWTLVAVLLLGLLFLMVSVLLPRPRRSADDGGSRPPWLTARTEMRGLEQMARVSVERGEALARESGARHRAEEDLKLSQTLLDRSRDERVRLGRDLHDNLCQTLYAVSLTLEGLRGSGARGGGGVAAPRLDQCIAELRRLNHEVRTYLKELEPMAVHRPPFLEALESMLAAQASPAPVRFVRNLDDEAIARIPPEQSTEVVSILREAISNSLRHSGARTITVHAQRGEGSVMLAVQDDGAGFDPAAAGAQGHGLANMQARAEALGGSLKVVSAPGNGTRVLLALPVISAP
jgi:signal transduction histidine kinase